MFEHLLEQTSKSVSNTDGRTDGLTKKVVTRDGDITSRTAREEHPKRACICLDELDSCPDNCFLRWF
jgi:hypothetical protein